MRERIKDAIADNIVFVVYAILVMYAWVSDSLAGTHRFNIADITMLGWQILALHGGNSLLNSPYGMMPGRSFTGSPVIPFGNKQSIQQQGGNSQNDNMRP